MTALAAAMATVNIEPEKRSSMIVSFREVCYWNGYRSTPAKIPSRYPALAPQARFQARGGARVFGLAWATCAARGFINPRMQFYSSWGVSSSTAPGSVWAGANAMESMKRPGSGEAKLLLAGSTVASSEMSLPLVK
jgi:hypothetical protein